MCTFSIATSESWKDKNSGERRDKTEWHRVVIFNEGLVRIAEQYLKKGSKVYLEGQLQTRKWEDKDGIEKYTTEVVLQNFNGNLTMLGGRSDNSVLGIVMWFNVWFVIWPNQKKALGIVKVEDSVKAASARTAMLFSRTNTLLSIPMLFSMVAAQNLF